MATFKFSLAANDKDKEYQNQIINARIDLCKLHDGKRSNFISKMVMENLYSSADFTIECPLKARNYHAWNYKFSADMIPNYLILNDIKFLWDTKIMVKIPQSNRMIYFLSTKVYGKVFKD